MANPAHHAAKRPDDPALIMATSGHVTTWRELHTQAVGAANLMWNHGLRPGDRVSFCVENSPEYMVLLWACQYSGLRWTPVSTRFTPEEVAFIVHDSQAKAFWHSALTAESTQTLDPKPGPIIFDLTTTPLADLATDEACYERVEGQSMVYSSGTTGRPKGVWQAAPDAPIEELGDADRLMAALMGFDETAVYLSTAPLYHSAPITFAKLTSRIGTPMVIMERFDASSALDAIQKYGVTHSQWVPTMFVRLLRLDEATRSAADLSTHRFAIHGAGPCRIETKHAMLDWWGPIIWEYYSGSEGAGTCLIGPDEWLAHPGSVGRSVTGTIRILDDDGIEVPPGQVGQIWFDNSTDFRYLDDETKTAESRGPDGRGTFGDLGYVDEQGYLYLTDRKSFTIVSGGVNIYPREIEQTLAAHPAVADVVVFGIPDEEFGEQVKAVVQPAPDVTADDALADELIQWCRDRLAHYKVPRSIDFDLELPREPTGKLRVGLVRSRYL